MDPNYPEPPPFVVPPREPITHEPPQMGDRWVPVHNDREYIDFEDQGGGYVPPTYQWPSNPKQRQEDLGSK